MVEGGWLVIASPVAVSIVIAFVVAGLNPVLVAVIEYVPTCSNTRPE